MKTKTGAGDTAYRFTGELQDRQVARGLYYLRARYYDPALGRFLGRDPFTGFVAGPQSQNRYIYNGNDPVDLVDPYGLCGLRSLGDAADCGKDAVDKVGEGAQKVGEGAQAVGGAVKGVAGAAASGYVDVGVTGCLPLVGPVGPCIAGAAGRVADAVQSSLEQQACNGTFGTLTGVTCPLFSPAFEGPREAAWEQINRASDWLVNTCAGQAARLGTGAAVVVGGGILAAGGQEWGLALIPLGVGIAAGPGPPSPLLENCW